MRRRNSFEEAILLPFTYKHSNDVVIDDFTAVTPIAADFDMNITCDLKLHGGWIPLCLATYLHNSSEAIRNYIRTYNSIPKLTLGLRGRRVVESTTVSVLKPAEVVVTLLNNRYFCKVISFNGKTYYGMMGIIMDENFKPILSLNIQYNFDNYNNVDFYNIICTIDPSVFEDQSDPVNKCIIQQVIPVYLKREEIYDYLSTSGCVCRELNANGDLLTYIGNSTPFIAKIIPPMVDKDVNDEMINKPYTIIL